jgi:hypothetical protein
MCSNGKLAESVRMVTVGHIGPANLGEEPIIRLPVRARAFIANGLFGVVAIRRTKRRKLIIITMQTEARLKGIINRIDNVVLGKSTIEIRTNGDIRITA